MKEKLKNMLTRNIGMKLLSVVLAFLIWIVIMSISNPQITKTIEDIPIERRNEEAVTAENMVYETKSSEKVTIRIKGMRSEIESLTAADFEAYVDFTEIGWVNAVPIHVVPKNAALNEYMEITSQSSDVMSIRLVEYATDMVMVEVKLENAPEEYYAYCSSVSSKLLEISGSKTQVESVEKLIAKVDLSGRTENFQTYVKLQAVDSKGNVIDESKLDIAQSTIQVEVDMLPVKEVPIVIDTSGVSISEGFGLAKVEYSPKTVLIATEQDVLRTIENITIPYKAEKLLQSKEEEIDITKYLPEGVFLKSDTTTMYLKLVVERLVSKEIVVDTYNLDVRNLPEQFGLSIQNSNVTITVWGIEAELEKLTSGDLALYVDMSASTGPGLFQVPVRTDCPSVYKLDTKISVVIYTKY